ncbi:choline ABC transporter substrate-binding protein [Marispirochaeta aestuarii]|uniref:choline ABC transporter substrate-binding protein n=1 Tax=Marispirochaeta aestuarii TaxID=1963862 RepID=UPI0029C69067|nr:choline ABC transporter substrate-binding protein [Marispirochaeta aestuarii]
MVFKTGKTLLSVVCVLFLVSGMLFAEGQQDNAPIEAKISDADTTVDFAEVQWTDINSTTAATRIVLEAMGYDTTSKIVSVPIAFQAISTGDIDVFLGDWEPSMRSITRPLLEEGEIIDYKTNLTGAKYTLAVPRYVADAGVTSFKDLAEHGEKFNYRIYGIEPGNDGNILIQQMIDSNAFGLGDFELIESSEAGMLAEVQAVTKNDEWIIFLGWAPHPMNTVFDIEYLADGDDYFGPDFGAATVHTITRVGYAAENPNLGRFFKNLEFTLDMEGEIMKMIADGMTAMDAAEAWLAENPAILDSWLKGVKAVDGRDALPVVRESLNI